MSKGWFPLPPNFSVRTHVKFTHVINEIEAMCERPRVNVKAERGSTFTFTRDLPYIRDLKRRERPGLQKWQPEVDIFSLSAVWPDKFIQQELKERLSDSLCATKVIHQATHRTFGCYSWRTGRQRSRCLSSLLWKSTLTLIDCGLPMSHNLYVYALPFQTLPPFHYRT